MFVPCEECQLRRRTLFRPFSELELSFITEMKTDHIVVAPRGDIIREDEVGGPVYTLFEGWAIRYHRLPHGARQILDIVLPGDTSGWPRRCWAGSSTPFRRSPRPPSVFFRAEVFLICSPVTRRWR